MSNEPNRQRYALRHLTGTFKGYFVKLGGGFTLDLQEAQIIGWRSVNNHRWSKGYQIIPVTISIANE